MKIGFLGLGKMGKRMVWKLLENGHDVVAWNRSPEAVEELVDEYESKTRSQRKKLGVLSVAPTIGDFKSLLKPTRVLWSMLPAGDATEQVMEQLGDVVAKKDIVIDGGNAYFKDTQRRFEHFKKMDVRFLGIGVSGGILAMENGFPMMVGGDKSAYDYIQPILTTFARPHGGYDYFGTGGAGHFIKMVHNGIEYGMMQAIGEGFGVLDKGPYKLDLEKVAEIWQKGTIISSFLIDRAKDALVKDDTLKNLVGYIEENGEAVWTIEAAKKEKVPVPVIEDSLEFRRKSQKSKKIQATFAARMVAALRLEFGGHKVHKAK